MSTSSAPTDPQCHQPMAIQSRTQIHQMITAIEHSIADANLALLHAKKDKERLRQMLRVARKNGSGASIEHLEDLQRNIERADEIIAHATMTRDVQGKELLRKAMEMLRRSEEIDAKAKVNEKYKCDGRGKKELEVKGKGLTGVDVEYNGETEGIKALPVAILVLVTTMSAVFMNYLMRMIAQSFIEG